MVDYYFPGFREKIDSCFLEDMYKQDTLITGYLVSKAFHKEYASLWKKDFKGARSHYDSYGLKLFGDCGAFSYVDEKVPPVTVEEVIDFHNEIDVDYGASLDHVITDYDTGYDYFFSGLSSPQEYKDRQEITIENGSKFLKECKAQGVRFLPIGSVQGWSPKSYKECILAFKKMGYKKIAIGGIARLPKQKLRGLLAAVKEVIGDTEIHLFGVTQPKVIVDSNLPNVTSVDGMAPFFNSVMRGLYLKTSRDIRQCVPIDDLNNLDSMVEAINNQDFDKVEMLADPNTTYNMKRIFKELKDGYWNKCDCVVCKTQKTKMAIHYTMSSRLRAFHNIQVIAREITNIKYQ
jgi:tRNA-guanine family transglycosylase